ncbi:flagellar protein FlgN [Sediminibacillus massiliensis]|uniref:flagellar protein FlgN n=1 Tax=Sediminibacillus massiliensis TaxID=1926277 RepID=UPI00098852CD|nr:flagellar protein FlgN [Sediminibacillus massiliensis]
MSVKPIVESLKNIAKLHESLLSISKDKTNCLKEGDTDKLQKLLVQERKHVQAINQLETKRQELVGEWAALNNMKPGEATVSAMIEKLDDHLDKTDLEKQFHHLTDVLIELKKQEQLNQELTEQSLQFLEFSIDMLDPSIKNMNYGTGTGQQSNKRSLFDSKA